MNTGRARASVIADTPFAQDALGSEPRSRTAPSSNAAAYPQRIVSVQILRAVAAALVLLGHAQHEVIRHAANSGETLERIPFLPGGFGVDLFFAISGFIMVVASRELFNTPRAHSRFLLRRAIRLVPLYWLVTLSYVAVLVYAAHPVLADLYTALFTSLLFVPYPTYGAEGAVVFPLYTLGWSLNYEVFFYLLFSMFVVLPAPRAVAAVCAALVLIVTAGFVAQPESVALRFWSQPIILEFGFGLLIGHAWMRGVRVSGFGALMAILGAIAVLAVDPMGLSVKVGDASTQNDLARVIGWGLPGAVMLAGAALYERHHPIGGRPVSVLAFLGDCSYSLYLVHPIALLVISKAWALLELDRVFGWPVLGVVLIAGSVCLAIASYHLFERPMSSWLHRRVGRAKSKP